MNVLRKKRKKPGIIKKNLLYVIISVLAWVCLIYNSRILLSGIALGNSKEQDQLDETDSDISSKQDQLKYVKTATEKAVSSSRKQKEKYIPADVEDYIINHFNKLTFNETYWKNAKGCDIWESPEASSQENYDQLQEYAKDLEEYNKAILDFKSPFPDIMDVIRERDSNLDDWGSVCKKLRPHPDGIKALFPSKQLSLTAAGYVEPLLTPMRHHSFCKSRNLVRDGLRMDYLVHDFENMCMKLKPTSRRVLIDMGASLDYFGRRKEPIIALMDVYQKFGFNFDHIYAFESTGKDPTEVYNKLLPKEHFASYHWINTGVSADKENKMDPLYSILDKFNEDDLIVVKLDIDTPDIEIPLANQLLADATLKKIVDHFYFEHHVHMFEIGPYWTTSMRGSIQSSFELMNGLRKDGIASHFWV